MITIIKTTRLSVTEAASVTGWPMHGKQPSIGNGK